MEVRSAMEQMAQEAKSLGADQFDILAGISESTGLSVFKGQVQNVELSNSQGLGIRLFREGFPGYAHTEKFSAEAIAEAVKIAWDNSYLTSKQSLELPTPVELPTKDLGKWAPALEEVSLEQMKPLCLEMESLALADSEVVNVPYLGMSRSRSELFVLNSKGVLYNNRANLLSGGIGCVAKRGENSKLGYYSSTLKDLSQFNAQHVAEMAVERSKELLGAQSLKTGKYPVLLSNRISGQLFSMFAGGFFADRVQKGQSRLEGKRGQKIAVETFQLSNLAHEIEFSGSSFFDAEGVATRDLKVVENGVLQSFLYNLESAQKEGCLSTGNGSRGYSSKAGTSFQNFVVAKGEDRLEDLLKKLGTGLYIVKLEGGSGCSGISGDISIGIQGLWVENGEIAFAVDGATLSSNFYELLQRIEGISDSYNPHYSSVRVPDILVSEVSLAG